MQDNNSERRNLVVLSFTFIASSIGEAVLTDSSIALSLINVKFQRVEALLVLAWITLLWFLFRYWLTNNGKFTRNLSEEFASYIDTKLVSDYFHKRIGQIPIPSVKKGAADNENEEGYVLENLKLESLVKASSHVGWVSGANIIRDKASGKVQSRNTANQLNDENGVPKRRAKLKLSRWVTVRLVIRCFFSRESFSAYLFPYLLFILAVLMALPSSLRVIFS